MEAGIANILSIFPYKLHISGTSQVGLNVMECLEQGGHNCWVYIHPKPTIASMYRQLFPGLKIVNETRWKKLVNGLLYGRKKPPKDFDLVIHYAHRKSYRDVPIFEGNHIVWILSEDAGFQSYFYDRIHVRKVIFVSHWEWRHYFERENYDNPRNSKGISVDEAWEIPRSWAKDRFTVQYPPVNEKHFDRFVRTSLKNTGQLIRKNKVRHDWFVDWYPFLINELPKIIPFQLEMDTITSNFSRRKFWSQQDAVIWVSSLKENFGMNLHEAIFTGCIPLVYDKNDASVELIDRYKFGFKFSNQSELIEKIEELKTSPDLVVRHSEQALLATEQLRYEDFYYSFVSKLDGII